MSPCDNKTKDELIDLIYHYKDAAFSFKLRAEWLLRRLETMGDVDEDEAAVVEGEFRAKLDRMLVTAKNNTDQPTDDKGALAQVWDTMYAFYGDEEAATLRCHYPRKWNAIRTALLSFSKQHHMIPLDAWKIAAEPLVANSEYAYEQVFSFPTAPEVIRDALPVVLDRRAKPVAEA